MFTPQNIILACWVIFVAYWAVSSIGVKKNIKGNSWLQGMRFRLTVILILLFFDRTIPSLGHFLRSLVAGHFLQFSNTSNGILGSIGATLTVIGIAFAIWARVHLGRNWGMPMSVKENPDLITTGPYTYVRHPIYTGMLAAMLGSAFANSLVWFVIFAIFLVYVLYSIQQEETLMTKTFPKEYPAYKKRTKALIPFIL